MTPVDNWETTMQANEKHRFRTREAAAYVRLAPSTMAKMRMRGDGPQYSKAGPRVVIYYQDELDAWLAARSRRSTSQFIDEQ
jgi:predicted DNA-binding transcriptional regulator AlpA